MPLIFGMRQFFKFLISPLFYVHITIAVILGFALLFWTGSYLEKKTLHGESVEVPDLSGKVLFKAIQELEERGLEYQILDSVYDESIAGGTVVTQLPLPYEHVKDGRDIYLTINSFSPPSVKLPPLKNKSLRQALATLQVLDISVDKYEYKPDICKDCVLEVMQGAKKLVAGDKITKGTSVVLVLGLGNGGGSGTEVPQLIGLTFKETIAELVNSSLNLGNLNFDACETASDSAMAIVFRQTPSHEPGEISPKGSFVDVWLTSDIESVEIPTDSVKVVEEGE